MKPVKFLSPVPLSILRPLVLLTVTAGLFTSCGKKKLQATFALKANSGAIYPLGAHSVFVVNKTTADKALQLRQNFKNDLTYIFGAETRNSLQSKGYNGPWSVDEIDKIDDLISTVSEQTGVQIKELQGEQRGGVFATSLMKSAMSRLAEEGRGEGDEHSSSDPSVNLKAGRKTLAEATDKVSEILKENAVRFKTDINGVVALKAGSNDYIFVTELREGMFFAWLLPASKITDSKATFTQEDCFFFGEKSKPAHYFFTPIEVMNEGAQILLSDEAYSIVHGPCNEWLNVRFRNE